MFRARLGGGESAPRPAEPVDAAAARRALGLAGRARPRSAPRPPHSVRAAAAGARHRARRAPRRASCCVQATLLAQDRRRRLRGRAGSATLRRDARRCWRSPSRAAARWPGGWRSPGAARLRACSPSCASRSSRAGCATQPTAADGTQSGEIAAAAVQGVEALEAYFARYLPQVVLASIVPFAVAGVGGDGRPRVGARDGAHAAARAGLHVADRPRTPSSAPASAGTRCGCSRRHFLDVVRGLPTLRAFNRGSAQAAAHRRGQRALPPRDDGDAAASRFLSGTVLELAATLGVALVAVTVGVRLVDGGLGLQAGLTVLVLAPELYLPLRRLGAEYHASADGLAVADRMLALLDAPAAARGGRAADRARAPRPRRCASSTSRSPTRRAPAACSTGSTSSWRRARRWRSSGESGAGKSTVAALLLRLAWSRRPAASPSAASTSRDCRADDWRAARRVGAAAARRSCAAASRTTSGSATRRIRRARCATPPRSPAPTPSSARCPVGYETLVGDGGRPLSPGERRRIGLARAFLRRSRRSSILDEPTADLDPRERRAVVSRAVERLRRRAHGAADRPPPRARRARRPRRASRGRRGVAVPARRAA